MAEVYFLGDPHFGHRNILKYRPQFKTIEEHDTHIINQINKVVTKRDKLILTGDVCFSRDSLHLFNRIKCPCIHIVLGNHDDYNIDFKKEVNTILWVSGDFKYKEFWISHIPLHPEELRGRFNIHAHMHGSCLDDPRYFNSNADVQNFKPVSLQQIRAELSKRKKKRSFVKKFRSWINNEWAIPK